MRLKFTAISVLILFSAICESSAVAQTIAWRVPTYGASPSVAGLGQQSLVFDASDNPYLFVYTSDSNGGGIRLTHYRAVDGSAAWQKDISVIAPSSSSLGSIYPTAALTTTADDAVVATTNYGAGHLYAEVARYRGTDGSELWRAGEYPQKDLAYAAIATDSTANIIAAGASGIVNITVISGHVAKFNNNDGSLAWSVDIGAGSCVPGAVANLQFSTAAIDKNGDALVAGFATQNQNTGLVFCVAKLSGVDGALLWAYGYTPSGSHPSANDLPSMAIDLQGNPIIGNAYTLPNTSPYFNFALVKLSGATGVPLWSEDPVVMGGSNVASASIIADASGNIVLSSGGGTRKYSSGDGHHLWPQDSAIGGAPAIDSLGNILLVQNASHDSTGPKMNFLALNGADGSQLWSNSFALGGFNYWDALAVAVDRSGHFAAAQTQSSLCCIGKQSLILKAQGTTGAIDWHTNDRVLGPSTATLLEPGPYISRTSALTPDDGIVSTGFSYNPDSVSDYSRQILVVKRSARDGHLMWSSTASLGSDGCRPSALVVDGNGDVIVVGNCFSEPRTIKLRGTDGKQLWVGSAQSSCAYAVASSVAIDAANDVYATGWCQQPNGLLTVKYASATGTPLWTQITDSSYSSHSQNLVAVDATGGVLIGGVIDPSGNGSALASSLSVKKLHAGDGSLVWSRRIDRPANGYDELGVMAVYPNGDLVISGSENGTTSNTLSARLNSSDGSVKWMTHDPAAVSPVAMMLDPAGDVLLAGGRSLWKYGGSDGSIGWALTSAPSADGFSDSFNDVTLDHSGNVVATGQCRVGGIRPFCVASVNDATGLQNWRLIGVDPGKYTVGIGVLVAKDGGILVSTNYAVPDTSPMSLLRITGPFADGIFAAGFEP
ncbi:hypothetical protein ELE36_06440 [Pseudolysobacter antarcticus]|uniref:Pyrrolo-quinoline quinone repeat domain-containing protein n=1 Tax=Pseudolysobacter antarcticus TaxID=2511995 RepID=A0A411HI08_9GAMM|nr:PQQ-binding-like beta-propeller repeat protein [Pseudolysobacter antarcticus]QBB70027.1 hypothetical protein ELE36_06440 [Pseudolysobacter antarcticus]